MGLKLKFGEKVSRIDAGIYVGIIKGVNVKHHPKNGDYLNWMVSVVGATLDGSPADNAVLGVNTGAQWDDGPKNTLNKLLKAVGIIVAIGEEIDVDQVIGKKLQVVVEDNETEKGFFSKVTSFLPLKKKPPVVQQPVEEAADEAEAAPVEEPKPAAKVVAKPMVVAPKPVGKAAPKPAPVVEEPAVEAPAEDSAVSEEDLFNFS